MSSISPDINGFSSLDEPSLGGHCLPSVGTREGVAPHTEELYRAAMNRYDNNIVNYHWSNVSLFPYVLFIFFKRFGRS